MKKKRINEEQLFQRNEDITKAIETVEDETQVLQRAVKDILDEVSDIIHDDLRFKNRIINKALVKPEFKEKIVTEFLTLMRVSG